MAKLPRRKCKVCREWFHPAYSNVVWCCPEHGAIYALELRAKEKIKAAARRIREKHQADKAERQRRQAKRESFKTKAQWDKEAQAGRYVYQQQELASLCGVKPDNWSHNYADYWRAMSNIFKRLDTESLFCLVKTRSQQKATFSQQGIAKVN
ncbi:TPA: bacteriophage antitermination protein Q [Salmonella enterica]